MGRGTGNQQFDLDDVERFAPISREEVEAERLAARRELIRGASRSVVETYTQKRPRLPEDLFASRALRDELLADQPLPEAEMLLDQIGLFPIEIDGQVSDSIGKALFDHACEIGIETHYQPMIVCELASNFRLMHLRSDGLSNIVLCGAKISQTGATNRGDWHNNPAKRCQACEQRARESFQNIHLQAAQNEVSPHNTFVLPNLETELRSGLREAIRQLLANGADSKTVREKVESASLALIADATGIAVRDLIFAKMPPRDIWWRLLWSNAHGNPIKREAREMIDKEIFGCSKGEETRNRQFDLDAVRKITQRALYSGLEKDQAFLFSLAALQDPQRMRKLFKRRYKGQGHPAVGQAGFKFLRDNYPSVTALSMRAQIQEMATERLGGMASNYVRQLAAVKGLP